MIVHLNAMSFVINDMREHHVGALLFLISTSFFFIFFLNYYLEFSRISAENVSNKQKCKSVWSINK